MPGYDDGYPLPDDGPAQSDLAARLAAAEAEVAKLRQQAEQKPAAAAQPAATQPQQPQAEKIAVVPAGQTGLPAEQAGLLARLQDRSVPYEQLREELAAAGFEPLDDSPRPSRVGMRPVRRAG